MYGSQLYRAREHSFPEVVSWGEFFHSNMNLRFLGFRFFGYTTKCISLKRVYCKADLRGADVPKFV